MSSCFLLQIFSIVLHILITLYYSTIVKDNITYIFSIALEQQNTNKTQKMKKKKEKQTKKQKQKTKPIISEGFL